MNTTAHTLISSITATGLALFTILAAAFTGFASTATITGISLFVVFGVIEIMIQSYAEPVGVLRGPRRKNTSAATSAMVQFPTSTAQREAA